MHAGGRVEIIKGPRHAGGVDAAGGGEGGAGDAVGERDLHVFKCRTKCEIRKGEYHRLSEIADLAINTHTQPMARPRKPREDDPWKQRALIPEAAVRRHRNASLDAFMGALSRHYEDLPMHDCPQRRLAAKIASIRLRAVEEVA